MKDHTPKSALPTVLEAHHINDKNMLYFRLCYTMFQPKLDHTQIETDEMLLFHEF